MYSLTLGRGDPSAGPGWCFFFCCGLAWTLTHSLRAWAAMPPAGVVFYFLLRPRPDRGVFFFFAVAPPGRSLTHCGPGRRCLPPGWCFFFCCGPARTGVVLFCLLWPRRTLTHSVRAWAAMPPAGVVFFFCCGPTRTGVVFFLLWPRPDAHSLTAGLGGDASRRGGVFFFAAAPPGPGWFFFFCCGPARTLTHSLRAWAAMPPAGVVFFFLLRPRPDRGGVFLFAHSLTVGWGDFGKARVVFFLLRPRRTRRANNKKCLVYYIGSNPAEPQQKKTPLPTFSSQIEGPKSRGNPEQKQNSTRSGMRRTGRSTIRP